MKDKINEELNSSYLEKQARLEKEIKELNEKLLGNQSNLNKLIKRSGAVAGEIGALSVDAEDYKRNDELEKARKAEAKIKAKKEENEDLIGLIDDQKERKKQLEDMLAKKGSELELNQANLNEEARKIRNERLKQNGLYEIFLKEHITMEEQMKIDKVIAEVVKEITKGLPEKDANSSTLHMIQALYNSEDEIKRVQASRKEMFSIGELGNIFKRYNKMPVAIKKPESKKQDVKISAPSDMNGAVQHATPSAVTKIKIYRDRVNNYLISADVVEELLGIKLLANEFVLKDVSETLTKITQKEAKEIIDAARDRGRGCTVIDVEEFAKPPRKTFVFENVEPVTGKDEGIPSIEDFYANYSKNSRMTEVLGMGDGDTFVPSDIEATAGFFDDLKDNKNEYTVNLRTRWAEKLINKLPNSLQYLLGDPIRAIARFDFWKNPDVRIAIENLHKSINELTDDKLDLLLEKKDKLINITKNKIANSMLLYRLKRYSKEKINQVGDMLYNKIYGYHPDDNDFEIKWHR